MPVLITVQALHACLLGSFSDTVSRKWVEQILKIGLSGKCFGDQEEVYQYFVSSVHWSQLITTFKWRTDVHLTL
jgi:PhoPQ-activated pathogenicity-related protein